MLFRIGDKESMDSPTGGRFLLEDSDPADVFTPEDFTSEQMAMAEAADEFIDGEVIPLTPRLEKQEPELMPALVRKSAALGFLAVDIPPEYGGLGLDVITSSLVAARLGRQASFGVAHGAHTGIGTLPLIYFGNEDQKRRYLPKLASGELIAAYALSETSSGSDALAAKTRAELNAEGTHYVLNGEKMWTSNGGFADLITLFAQVDGNKLSAFLVERSFPGVSSGREEHKLGIKGSSTTRIILDHALVPKENLLYQVGRGHLVALNVLNICRYRLAIGIQGAAQDTLGIAARYAKERRQFGKPIADFGLIREKLAEMAIRLFAAETACIRVGGLIQSYGSVGAYLNRPAEEPVKPSDPATSPAVDLPLHARAAEEFLVECAMMKVHSSETLDYVVDEALQIHGGYGYTEEFPVARAYRDARINRIFEGTNEINRLTIPGTLLRRAQRGRLPLLSAMQAAAHEALESVPDSDGCEGELSAQCQAVSAARKLALLTAGAAAQRFGEALADEQEILGALADMIIEFFIMESALLRVRKKIALSPASSSTMTAAAQVVVDAGLLKLEHSARRIVAACAEGDELVAQMAVLRKYTRGAPVNVVALRRRVAQAVLEADGYPFR